MKNNLILAVSAIVIIGAFLFFFLNKGGENKEVVTTTDNSSIVEEAWIEIVAGTAFLKTGGQGTELKDGDTLAKGVSVETGRTGQAIIHFPDGSVLRMDKETSITLNGVYFKKDDGSLVVKIGLAFGRTWSKVIGLTTPESEWEVKTSNTVATVRGTAFGMGFSNGRSWMLADQHTVAVSPIDPISKEAIKNAEVVVEAGKLIEIGEKEVKEAVVATTTGAFDKKVVAVTPTFSNDTWIKEVKKADYELERKIDEIRKKEKDEKTIREKLIEKTKLEQEVFKPRIEEKNDSKRKDTMKAETEVKTDTKKDLRSELQKKLDGADTTSLPEEIKIGIRTSDKTSVEEGATIKFVAYLISVGELAGSDITSKVKWSSEGSIGNISSAGVFVARLGDDIAEVGEGAGFIIATYKTSSGKEIKALSPLIRVVASGPERPLDIGGQ